MSVSRCRYNKKICRKYFVTFNQRTYEKRVKKKESKSSDFYLKLLGMRSNYELCEKILNRDEKIF